MTPGARTQAVIELLTHIFKSWESEKRIPADKLLENYFKSHRYIGSKDRGAVSELVYWILRHKSALQWWLEREGMPFEARSMVWAALIFRKDFNPTSIRSLSQDSKYSPMPLTDLEIKLITTLIRHDLEHPGMPDYVRLNYPEWMDAQLKETFGTEYEAAIHALNMQAPMDLRVNTLKTTREELMNNLQAEGFEVELTPTSPVGLRLQKRAPLFTSQYFKLGHFEVQDEGSQIAATLVNAEPGQKVIDFCAGAGGKTLAIAAAMKNKGRILAWDTSEKRLSQLPQRLRRAGVDNVQLHPITSEHDPFLKRHLQSADRVVVDAPCSGTGTWRRNPDLKWRFTPKDLEEVMALQAAILQNASRLVKTGGRLIYITCSVLQNENERQINQFLKNVNNFRVVCAEKIWNKSLEDGTNHQVSYLSLTPHQDGVDGFFVAILEKLAGEPEKGVSA